MVRLNQDNLNRGRIRVEYGVHEGHEESDYSAAIYERLTLEQVDAVQAVLDALIRPNWEQRSHVPS